MPSNPYHIALDKSQETIIIVINFTIYHSSKIYNIDGENEVDIGLCLLQNFEPN